jgi:hypothetical protein
MTTRKPHAMRPLTNSRDAIKALGGDAQVMAWLRAAGFDMEAGRLSMIKSRGYIPRGLHLHFYLTLQDRGLEGAASLYGLTPDQYASLIMPRTPRKRSGIDMNKGSKRIIAAA